MNAAAIIAMRDALAAHGYSVVKTSKLKKLLEEKLDRENAPPEPVFVDRPVYPNAEALYACHEIDRFGLERYQKEERENILQSREREIEDSLFAEIRRRKWVRIERMYSPVRDGQIIRGMITVVPPKHQVQILPPYERYEGKYLGYGGGPHNPDIKGAL